MVPYWACVSEGTRLDANGDSRIVTLMLVYFVFVLLCAGVVATRSALKPYVDAGLDNLLVFMKVEGMRGNDVRYRYFLQRILHAGAFACAAHVCCPVSCTCDALWGSLRRSLTNF